MLFLMAVIREFEQSLLDMFQKGLLGGTTHTCLGQEGAAVGVISALNLELDIVFSNHRGHGHFLSYCGEVEALYCEVLGKPSGICKGVGGSQHLHFRNFYSNGVQGGIAPVSAGIAFREKKRDTSAIVTVFLGDGTLGEGAVYEALNMASLYKLPVLFVVENNDIAQTTPRSMQMAGSIRKRFEAFEIPVKELMFPTADVVREIASLCVDEARQNIFPHALIIHEHRMGPHSKGDDTRSREQLESMRKQDPLLLISNKVSNAEQIFQNAKNFVEKAQQSALTQPNYSNHESTA
jgi:TPP-dependent pyruvate/acetoin dehydrogenase alpha subunit